ncbi:hypothetical protein [Streptomyces boncukensis]|uniref:Uncharacterized protein n=1 Tax=Streptomyces boncukensis TaxID=2711219 RepID=A0A6G4X2F7_9ACTN|nr:hypothetical protein [Streptomyces boncukensis]NGO71322.1 hypothetical protein [Streptomyces boncukensis]
MNPYRRGEAVYDTVRGQPAFVAEADGRWLTLVRPGHRSWRTHEAVVRSADERERATLLALASLVRERRDRELSARVREANRRSRDRWGRDV